MYVGTPTGEKRTYVSESAELLRRFFAKYEVEDGCVALSDNGNSLFPKGQSILLDLGFDLHVPYPAAVHQYLSPNDNHLHGTAKTQWRCSGVDFCRRCSVLINASEVP